MENASNAIKIAGELLIGLLLIVVYSILKRVIHNNVDKIK